MPPQDRQELIEALLKDIDPGQDPDLYNDTRQAFEQGTDAQLTAWYNQQNDPGQARENAWSAGIEAANRDLTQNVTSEISAAEKEAIMKELANDLDSLEKNLTHDQSLLPDHEPDHEQEH